MSIVKPHELAKFGITYKGNSQPKILDQAAKAKFAMDSALITEASGGILPLFTTFADPEVIRILFSPMPLTSAFSEVMKGDWTTTSMTFPVIEGTGKPTTYGDWNDNGTTNANANFISRQPYTFQEFISIGELEEEMYGQAKISWASELQTMCALSLNKLSHEIYAFGVEGLQNYGMLNDPNLNAPITSSVAWTTADPLALFGDIQKIYDQLVKQANGLVKRTDKLLLLLSPTSEAKLVATNMYGLNAYDIIMKNFPNLEIIAVPEYLTEGGEVIQMVLKDYNGSENVQLGYNVKMRVHPIVQGNSGYTQKRTQGCYGAIIRRPQFVAQMIIDTTP